MKTLPLFFLYSFLLFTFAATAQNKKNIIIKHADYSDINQAEIPDAVLLTGNIEAEHDGVLINCNKAYYFEKENYIKLFGNVIMNQGDTIHMNSRYAEYNGMNGFAYANGEVVMRSPNSMLETDTIHFDRNQNIAYYNSFGKITNEGNILTSQAGKYLINDKKFQFINAVTITTDQGTVVKSNHLDYYEVPQHSYVFGPSTITSKDNYIYTENGFYDVKQDIGKLIKNSHIIYDNRRIEGDSMYYDKKRDFSSATNNVKITDTINKMIIRGHYAEVYKAQDSMFVTKKALITTVTENDSVYIHAKRILVTGKPDARIIRGFNDARIFKTDMSGKSDSLHYSQQVGLTQMIGRPVVWNGDSQLTGQLIHLINNPLTEQLDSLKVLNDAFVIQQDTLGTGFNQVKGQNLYGKFRDNKMYEIDLIKNAEIIYYMYNDDDEFVGINKGVCSQINLELEENKIQTATLYVEPQSEIYPEADLPENARKLRDFLWRGDERIRTLEEIFPESELMLDAKIQEESEIQQKEAEVPMEIQSETLGKPKKDSKDSKDSKKNKK
ncbi:OstA-like protein [Flavobacterium sp. JP2137]|uniref:OstA-like protein n=1 Tax=Flavobacterium sp. JP2137 TaxID=3414510 RepID=UPI003D2FCE0D